MIPHAPLAQNTPAHKTRTVTTFGVVNGVPEVAQGITTDGPGGLYLSLFFQDEIWQLNPATGAKKKIADVPGGGLKGNFIGLERDPADGTIRRSCLKQGVLTTFGDQAGTFGKG